MSELRATLLGIIQSPQAAGDIDQHGIIGPFTQHVHIRQIMWALPQPWQVDKAGLMTLPNRCGN